MTSFNDTRAPASRKYVAEQVIVIQNWSKTFQTFWSHSSVLGLEEKSEKLNFQSFLHLRNPLVASNNETRAPTSRIYVADKGIVMPNWLKTFQNFWSHSSVFPLENRPEILNFQSFFTSKKLSGG